MLATAGMILQEVVTHDKLLPMLSVSGQELVTTMAEQNLLAAAAAENRMSMLALMGEAEAEAASFDGQAYAKTLPGIRDNAEFFDPLRFCSQRGVTEGKIKFYREVELKHGRLGMLASLGIVVGDIDVPAYLAFQQTPLQAFWPAVVLAIAIPEIYSVLSFNEVPGGQLWSIQSDHDS